MVFKKFYVESFACVNTRSLGSSSSDISAEYNGFSVFYFAVDINECSTNNGGCDINAVCLNTGGGYTCTCNSGYTGDGNTCTGKTTV